MNNKEVDLEVADMMGDIETVADGNALGCYFCASTASSATGCAATASTASTLVIKTVSGSAFRSAIVPSPLAQ